MSVSPAVQAFADYIRTQPAWPDPVRVEELDGYDTAPPDVKCVIDALGSHHGPIVATWETGLQTSQAILATVQGWSSWESYHPRRDHAIAIGTQSGDADLVIIWDDRRHSVFSVYAEEGYIKEKLLNLDFVVRSWMNKHPEDEVIQEMCAAFGNHTDALPVVKLSPSKKPIQHPQPPDAEVLKAGDHMWYLHAAGTTVSISKKGMRYLNDKGKRKTFNDPVKSAMNPRYGGIRSDGGRAYHLGNEALHWIDLPAGKTKGSITIDPHPQAMVMWSDDLFLFRYSCELRLCRLEGDAFVELERLRDLRFGERGALVPVFAGRGFLLTHPDSRKPREEGYFGKISDDRIVLTARVPSSFYPWKNWIQDNIVDGADEILVRVYGGTASLSREAVGL